MIMTHTAQAIANRYASKHFLPSEVSALVQKIEHKKKDLDQEELLFREACFELRRSVQNFVESPEFREVRKGSRSTEERDLLALYDLVHEVKLFSRILMLADTTRRSLMFCALKLSSKYKVAFDIVGRYFKS